MHCECQSYYLCVDCERLAMLRGDLVPRREIAKYEAWIAIIEGKLNVNAGGGRIIAAIDRLQQDVRSYREQVGQQQREIERLREQPVLVNGDLKDQRDNLREANKRLEAKLRAVREAANVWS